jgi:cytochrome c oxidase assembly protein subunit 20
MGSAEKPSFSFYILRKDIFKVPCFKQTMIYSISSWISVGLLTFLFTSKPMFSSHCGFASYLVVTLGYFTHCRFEFKKQQTLINQFQDMILKKNIMEGTHYGKENESTKPVLEDA